MTYRYTYTFSKLYAGQLIKSTRFFNSRKLYDPEYDTDKIIKDIGKRHGKITFESWTQIQ